MKKCKSRCLQAVLMTLSLVAVCNSANAADNIGEVADKAGTFTTLLTAAKAAGLAHTLQEEGPFTVFAPTDDAFAKLPSHTLQDLLKPENKEKLATILKYHVLSGKVSAKNAVQVGSAKTFAGDSVTISIRDGRLAVNDATVILNDVGASNGIIHVIDSVLMPPEPKNIVETAAAAGNFQTLLSAVEAAGLVETLQGRGPFTVFAPSDKAFTKLVKETLASLLKPESKHKLQAILKYHVVPGRLSFDDIEHLKAIKTAQGAEVRVKVDAFADPYPGLAINQSNIISGDIDAANGIIHVIDQVLMPPDEGPRVFKQDSDFRLLQRLDPELIATLKSRTAGDRTTVTFCNLSPQPIQVYWVDRHGKRKKWRDLIGPTALEVCERTFSNHVWLITDQHGEGLGLYVIDKQDGLVVYK
ncbi:MAG: fasciclin domain-containing protein [Rubripirellula sp.]|nr:fasciclin domain-containing protein [Rubripirellula sp.]